MSVYLEEYFHQVLSFYEKMFPKYEGEGDYRSPPPMSGKDFLKPCGIVLIVLFARLPRDNSTVYSDTFDTFSNVYVRL